MTTTYIGIDLHKRTQTWVALAENGKDTLFTREFSVTPAGVEAGINISKSYGEKIVAAIEPTCGWSVGWCRSCASAASKCTLVIRAR